MLPGGSFKKIVDEKQEALATIIDAFLQERENRGFGR